MSGNLAAIIGCAFVDPQEIYSLVYFGDLLYNQYPSNF